ncbi:hypothetical protein FANTH_1986 [Fusarium anthophilum]|uniref:F-box domain-containing protein n=1 Tax=Fusarium anthophilum TaxID=48485 RepID=A0A8H4ZW75_9HYPO|nr:hypothetical protein FANTH_1986 [Fusarium anthophilum]
MNSTEQRPDNLSILNRLPLELLNQVIYTLPNADIKNLRLTCSYLGNASLPRFDRVFISTNLRDIEVFTLIANHDRFRFKVTEIIYEDSRFGHPSSSRYKEWNRNPNDPTRVPYWFRKFYYSILSAIDTREEEFQSMSHVKEAFKTRCTLAESYQVYYKLKAQQDEVLAYGRDADALRHGLLRFPNLKRVTLSPAAHGILGRPLYPTPTIRSLPEGLIYPVEQGWPTNVMEEHPLTPWDEISKRKWRGFCVVTKEVAQHIRDNPMFQLSEFVMESRLLWTGTSCRVFDSAASEEYRDLVTILSHPPLRRLELSFASGEESKKNWPSFRSGLLFRALSKANNLQDFRFDTGIPPLTRSWHNIVGYEQNGLPLRSMFPVKNWSNLRRLALSRSFVTKRDVIAFISTLPSSLESLELSFLEFFIGEGTYRNLLEDMRCNLDWRERPSSNQPKLIILVVENESNIDGVAIDLSREAMGYVYHHGENPFLEEQIMEVIEGKGVPVNLLDPMYDGESYHGRVMSV